MSRTANIGMKQPIQLDLDELWPWYVTFDIINIYKGAHATSITQVKLQVDSQLFK